MLSNTVDVHKKQRQCATLCTSTAKFRKSVNGLTWNATKELNV